MITPLMRINYRLIKFEIESTLIKIKFSNNVENYGSYICALFQQKTYNDLLHSQCFNNPVGSKFNTDILTLEYL